jgi:hypothetical protein
MKYTIGILFTLIVIAGCSNKKLSGTCLKGRLEIKGICSNYTIKILEGHVDDDSIATEWTDENTGKKYTNVFALGNPCSFPESINAGDEFYFTVQPAGDEGCMTCKAYYPKPAKALNIKVLDKPCNE